MFRSMIKREQQKAQRANQNMKLAEEGKPLGPT